MAGVKFQTKVTTSRTKGFLGLDGPAMQRIAEKVLVSVKMRISNGLDVNDRPAPPLKPRPMTRRGKDGMITFQDRARSGYADAKRRRNIPPIRNWRFTGKLMNSMVVLSARPNQATIGFIERAYNLKFGYATTNFVAAQNNRRWPQFGVSRKDDAVLRNAVMAEASTTARSKVA